MRAVHPGFKADALATLCKICEDPLPSKSSFCLRVASSHKYIPVANEITLNNSTHRHLLELSRLRDPGAYQTRRPVIITALQLIDVIGRAGKMHAEVISCLDNKKDDPLVVTIADTLLFTVNNIGPANGMLISSLYWIDLILDALLISCTISAIMTLCIHCPDNIRALFHLFLTI